MDKNFLDEEKKKKIKRKKHRKIDKKSEGELKVEAKKRKKAPEIKKNEDEKKIATDKKEKDLLKEELKEKGKNFKKENKKALKEVKSKSFFMFKNNKKKKESINLLDKSKKDAKKKKKIFTLKKKNFDKSQVPLAEYEKYKLKEGEEIPKEYLNFVIESFNKKYEKEGGFYIPELISYFKDNEIWNKKEIELIDQKAWSEAEELIKEYIKKKSATKSSRLRYLAYKYMDKPEYKSPKFIPVDYETTDGKTYPFFNIEKTLIANNKMWITKIIPLKKLERFTYDNALLDFYTRKFQEPRYKKYNEMSEENKMIANLRKKIIKISISSFLSLSLVLAFFSYYRPRKIYKDAREAFNLSLYDRAYELFSKTNYLDAYARAGLSLERSYIEKNKYEDALKILDKMDARNITFNDILLTQERKELLYKKALYDLSERKFIDARDTFRELKNYKKSKEYFNKASYKVAEDFFDKGELIDALKSFKEIYGYSDSKKRYNEIGEGLYSSAILLYNKGDLKDAKEEFENLSKVNFRDSKDLTLQCDYKIGLDYINKGRYTKAINTFKEIKTFKDSYSLMEEARYRYAKNLFNTDVVKSINQFSKIEGYKDSYEYITNPKIALYGSWSVKEMNDTKPDKININFYEDSTLNSNKAALNLAISSKANKKPYKFEKDEFKADGNYTIKLKDIEVNSLTLIAEHDKKKTIYKLKREKSLTELLTDENRSKKILGEETKEIAISNIAKEFLYKKIKE